jgi:uncharacterized C2H2 Zn-finger protein
MEVTTMAKCSRCNRVLKEETVFVSELLTSLSLIKISENDSGIFYKCNKCDKLHHRDGRAVKIKVREKNVGKKITMNVFLASREMGKSFMFYLYGVKVGLEPHDYNRTYFGRLAFPKPI